MMTALLVIEDGRARTQDPGARRRRRYVEPNKEGLVAGRWYPRRLLLYSALMVSANDSATTLAYDAGGGSLARFYRTDEREGAGARDDRHDVPERVRARTTTTNLSSARDQAILARAALENPLFAQIVRTPRKLVEVAAADVSRRSG